ncbi:GNAT family N-acetyltransferase [Leuconostoc koreense]|nr:GNAT family N-acetyltransferase [Leuconostoc mesenteroides]QGM24927.1 GNAT family N-acetyltransferase [Leuconostoc mesenteroides subsp. mesenteroides]
MTSPKNSLQIKSTKNLVLRAMQPTDSEALARIYLGTRQHNFSWIKHPKLEDFARDSHGEMVEVAIINQEVVGFASISEHDSFLHLLFIKEGWNGCGIGAKLLDWARNQVMQALELKVVTANVAAQRFYEREGFLVVGKSVLSKPQNLTYRDSKK